MEKILVSACLLGEKVRFDGRDKLIDHPLFHRWQNEQRIISFCPEVAGGLPTPRPPAEIIGVGGGKSVLAGNARVVSLDKHSTTHDVTQAFEKGAQQALTICQQHRIQFAILTAKSPSCGNGQIYDGNFNGTAIAGEGVTAALLTKSGIQVYNQHELDKLQAALTQI